MRFWPSLSCDCNLFSKSHLDVGGNVQCTNIIAMIRECIMYSLGAIGALHSVVHWMIMAGRITYMTWSSFREQIGSLNEFVTPLPSLPVSGLGENIKIHRWCREGEKRSNSSQFWSFPSEHWSSLKFRSSQQELRRKYGFIQMKSFFFSLFSVRETRDSVEELD